MQRALRLPDPGAGTLAVEGSLSSLSSVPSFNALPVTPPLGVLLFPHLVANNTRFVMLGERGVLANLGSWMMAAMLRRISADWQAQYGHPLLVVESFVDPQLVRFGRTVLP